MQQTLTLDFATEFLQERSDILKLIYSTRLTGVREDGTFTHPKIEIDRDLETYSTGEQAVIKFVQSPQTPLDLSKLDGSLGRACLDLHTKFWRLRYGMAA
jgi:hypothetical protein